MSLIKFPFETPPEGIEMIEVAEGIHWIRLPLPMKLDHVNIYVLEDEGGWTVIDTGMNTGKTRALWQALIEGPLKARPINRVILTHHHPDHVGLVGWMQSEYRAELWTTRTAWLFARMLTLDVQETWPEETLAYYRSAGMDSDFYEKRKAERPFNYSDVVAPMPLGFKSLDEGHTLTIGAREFTVRLGQGHAPDHITLWADDVVIAGDQMIANISSNLGVYATEPEADPVGAWFDSCERLKVFAKPEHLVLPGHKLPYTGLATRLTQLINNHHTALDRLNAHLAEPRTATECFQPLFKRKISEGEYGLALVEAVGHLNHLHQLGTVSRTRRQDGAYLWRIG